MGHVVLVRHGKAAAGWSDDLDPGLDDLGRQQAQAMADRLHLFGPLPLFSSPLRRCIETAEALGDRWGVEPAISADVGEVESPTADLAERGVWLRGFMASTWADQPAELLAWRQRIVDFLLATEVVQAGVEVVGPAGGRLPVADEDDVAHVRRARRRARSPPCPRGRPGG